MTREETKKIINGMMIAYPNYHPANLTDTVDMWATMLTDYTYEVVSAALKAFIVSDTSGFAPSIGQLVDMLHRNTEDTSAEEAWAYVTKAIRNGTYGAEEEFERLPVLAQQAVGRPENLRSWAMVPSDEVQTVIHSQFIRSYRTVQERSKMDAKIPQRVRELIEAATPAIEQKGVAV